MCRMTVALNDAVRNETGLIHVDLLCLSDVLMLCREIEMVNLTIENGNMPTWLDLVSVSYLVDEEGTEWCDGYYPGCPGADVNVSHLCELKNVTTGLGEIHVSNENLGVSYISKLISNLRKGLTLRDIFPNWTQSDAEEDRLVEFDSKVRRLSSKQQDQ